MEAETFLKNLYEENDKDYGLCCAPVDAQKALNVLIDHFLGEDWHVVMPLGAEQINTEAVYAILERNQGGLLDKLFGK